MKAWSLERAAHLDWQAATAILQSMAQTKLGRHSPCSFFEQTPADFAAMHWESLECTEEILKAIARQFTDMFHVDMQPPALHEEIGMFVRRSLAVWQESERPMTFLTSGSTGRPKPCTHLESHFRQVVTSVAPLVEDRKSILVTVPLHHTYGFLFGLLLPLSLGIPARNTLLLPTLVDAQMRPGDMVVGIPLLWSRLAAMKNWQTGHSDAGRDITIFTSTAPMPPEIMHAMLRNGFRAVEIFGSAETSAIGYREYPDDPFSLLPHWKRGTGEHEGTLERLLPEGTLRRYPILDSITWTGARSLRLGARLDKAVQVAGVNVYPLHVGSVLERHEGVNQCLVRLMRPDEGDRLKAFVVPRPGWDEQVLRKSLALFARRHLKDAQRPVRYVFGEDIPRGPLGKPTDW
jgi:4-coumarate--CoA ligase (photoactive yellow protein activation family)